MFFCSQVFSAKEVIDRYIALSDKRSFRLLKVIVVDSYDDLLFIDQPEHPFTAEPDSSREALLHIKDGAEISVDERYRLEHGGIYAEKGHSRKCVNCKTYNMNSVCGWVLKPS